MYAKTIDNDFWKEVIESWETLIDDPEDIDDVLKIPLWNSDFVKNENIYQDIFILYNKIAS